MRLAPHGQQRVDGRIDAGGDVRLTEVAGVGEQLRDRPEVVGQLAQGVEHRGELLLIVGGLSDRGRDDEHRIGVHRRLGIVALLKAPPGAGMMRESASVRLT